MGSSNEVGPIVRYNGKWFVLKLELFQSRFDDILYVLCSVLLLELPCEQDKILRKEVFTEGVKSDRQISRSVFRPTISCNCHKWECSNGCDHLVLSTNKPGTSFLISEYFSGIKSLDKCVREGRSYVGAIV